MFDGIAEHEGRNRDYVLRNCLIFFFYCFFLIYFYLTIDK